MRVLHICYSDNKGGAAIAALRLVKALRKNGVDAQLLTVVKNTDYPYVTSVSKYKNFIIRFLNKIVSLIVGKLNKSTNLILHSVNLFGAGLHKKINKMDCDIVHLHWIGSGMLSIREIAKIKKPIIWTMHDSWAFSGAEHHPNGMDDKSFTKAYYPNPYKGVNINRWVFRRKKRFWKKCKFIIITPSYWESNAARESLLFNNYKIKTIPNCLDTDIFKPINKIMAKEILGLEGDKKYILFGANDPTDHVKGGDLLINILEKFNDLYGYNDIEILIFGTSYNRFFEELEFPIRFLGKIYDEFTMSLIYNAVDVMLVTSRMDNLPQTATESISCGTPTVCFEVGGLVDIVEHRKNGYIANRFDILDFVEGINWVLNESDYSMISANARRKAMFEYNEERCVQSHINIYNDINKI